MNPYIIFLLNKSLESLRISNLDSAESYLKQAAKLEKNNPHVLILLGVICAQRFQYSEALKNFTKSLKVLPDNALTLSNLGIVYVELNQYQDALSTFDKAIKVDRNYEEVWTNKGILLSKIKQHQEAIYHHTNAINLKPTYAEAWSNRGNALCELRRYEEALNDYDKALHLKPDYAECWYNKANVLVNLKSFSEAIFHYEKAISFNSNLDWIHGHLIHLKMQICDWSSFKKIRDDILFKSKENKKVSHPLPLMSLFDDISLHHQVSNIFVSSVTSKFITGQIQKLPKKEKVRIAYFSADFHNHPVSHLTAELFEIHNRKQFEVIAFSIHTEPYSDLTNKRLRLAFDKFIEVDTIADIDVARLCRQMEIDIAIDLSGHTKNSRPLIFAYRAAPIQVNWLGFPGTFGSNYIDYIIADKTIIHDKHKVFYNEKVVYLPNSYLVDDSKRVPSDRVFTKSDIGLPNDKFIFCCFNNSYKFNPDLLDSWSRIFLAVSNSVLWVSNNNELFRNGLILEFERRGIQSNRIIFAPRVDLMGDHLARHCLADLFLDTFPYNAHTTALDAIKTGLPIITRIGESFPSRVAASLLNTIEIPELITSSQAEYEALAIELATNPKILNAIKSKLAANRLNSPLFDTPLFAKNLETAYLKMYERYQAGLTTDHIVVSS